MRSWISGLGAVLTMAAGLGAGAPAEALFGGGGKGCTPVPDNDRRSHPGDRQCERRGSMSWKRRSTTRSICRRASRRRMRPRTQRRSRRRSTVTRRSGPRPNGTRRRWRAQVARRPSRSACAVVTGARGLAQARVAAAVAGRTASVSETGRIAGDRATGSAPAAATDSAERYTLMLERWCSAERAPLQSAVCRGRAEDHGADLRPDSLFGVESFRSDEELQAAIALSRNLTAPVVEDPEPLGAVDSASERERVMMSRAAAARRALAAEALGHLRALRAPGPELGAWASAVDPGRDADAAVSPAGADRPAVREAISSGRNGGRSSSRWEGQRCCGRRRRCWPPRCCWTGSGFISRRGGLRCRRRCWRRRSTATGR